MEYYNKDGFTFQKKVKNLKDAQIDEIKKLITNLNNCSRKYEIIYRIIIKMEKKKSISI